MHHRHKGCTQAAAAAKAGLSARRGRRIDQAGGPRLTSKRDWRTRHDPLAAVWEPELLLLLRAEPPGQEALYGRANGITTLAHRYESGSLVITANQPFSDWDHIFPDSMMTVAAVDRLIHHASIIELEGESYRKAHQLARATSARSKTVNRPT